MKKILVVCFMALFFMCSTSASASEKEEVNKIEDIVVDSASNTRGILINITADIYLEDGYVVGKAHNVFTFGFSTIYTVVILYSSDTFTENKDEMDYECYTEITDLDIGKSITTRTLNEGKYYRCVVRYKDGPGEWVFIESDTAKF